MGSVLPFMDATLQSLKAAALLDADAPRDSRSFALKQRAFALRCTKRVVSAPLGSRLVSVFLSTRLVSLFLCRVSGQFRKDVALAVHAAESRFKLLSVSQGSVIVDLYITPPLLDVSLYPLDPRTARALALALILQVRVSPLRNQRREINDRNQRQDEIKDTAQHLTGASCTEHAVSGA